ncbi:Glycine cleavage system H protein 2 [Trichoderma lentiforme]|uniref:Glycine cleavage system H protein n=1 Tax=Trichoderma lentiforme TaxID=1567552 RepID=A0A9P4X6T9_9HYPO|nr:Glycine cleavage system H protein 2 [Trichoderma lentiforme]
MASIACSLRAARPVAMRLAPRAAPMVRLSMPARSFTSSRMTNLDFFVSSGLARKYTKDHEWIDLSADRKTGVIGVSEYAAEQLGDVVYVELPPAGEWTDQGDSIGAVESVKSASDINAPVRCKVTHTNALLEEKPATINQVPEDDSAGGGWIVKVEVDEEGAKQFDELMDAEAYKEFVAE